MSADVSFSQEAGTGIYTNKASLFGSFLWMKSIDWKKNPFIIIGGLCRDSDKHQESHPLYFSHFHPHWLPCVHQYKSHTRAGTTRPCIWLFTSAPGPSSEPLKSTRTVESQSTVRPSVIIQESDSMVLVRIFHNPMIIHHISLSHFTTATLNTKIFQESCLFLLLLLFFFYFNPNLFTSFTCLELVFWVTQKYCSILFPSMWSWTASGAAGWKQLHSCGSLTFWSVSEK